MRERLRPAEAFPPGVYVRKELEARGWTQGDLADILGRPVQTISDIINGKRGITPETATGLAAAFGTSAQLWMNLQTSFDLWNATAGKNTDDISRRAQLYELAPIHQMVKRGWIEGSSNTEVLQQRILDFFGISSLDEEPKLNYAARGPGGHQSDGPSPGVRAWLFRARHLARAISAKPFRGESVGKILEQLTPIRHSPEELRHVPRILADGGIRLVVIEPLPRTKIDGGCFWLDAESPVIVLSLRYDRVDWFWHTLMHELVHIERMDGEQWDDFSESDSRLGSQIERATEERAADYLVPTQELISFINRTRPLYSKAKIRRFAARMGVHPGIVVGQLQHRKEVAWSHDREMLVRVRDIVTDSALTDGWGHTLPVDM